MRTVPSLTISPSMLCSEGLPGPGGAYSRGVPAPRGGAWSWEGGAWSRGGILGRALLCKFYVRDPPSFCHQSKTLVTQKENIKEQRFSFWHLVGNIFPVRMRLQFLEIAYIQDRSYQVNLKINSLLGMVSSALKSL